MNLTDKINLTTDMVEPLKRILTDALNVDFIVDETPWGGIWFRSEENELYLKSNYGKVLVISRIEFSIKRKGIGTETFLWLKKIAKENGFLSMLIESTQTKEINRFADKHGFKPIESQGVFINDEFFGNYQLIL